MTDNRIESLLSALGYKDVKYFHLLKDFSSISSLSHLSRIFNRINQNENIEIFGAYSIKTDADEQQTESLRPVVFVAKAETVNDARKLHQDLWNSSSVPFVIVILPDQIKVYTGFDYDQKDEKHGELTEIPNAQIGLFGELSSVVIEALQEYSAESVNNGSIWQKLQNSPNFNYDNRVDKKLLHNLEELEQELVKKLKNSISEAEALKHIHSIIGKYVYFRYLKDRKILTEDWAKTQNIDLDIVFNRGATLSELKKLSDAVEARFEGQIFSFPEGFENVFNDALVSYVASVFFGDSASGQLVMFSIYDFSYIPVETLSYIYEQFLKSQGLSKKNGAVYTPESLADYLINEISSVKPLKRGMKILDPCCGSGIFLVLTYRYLVELELQKQDVSNLKPDELKQIMEESIYGVELNPEACQVTEFSLILILLNYIEPPDLAQNSSFKFPNLHESNIFEGDFFDPRKEFYPLTMGFDWIIGNPPWKSLNVKKNPQDKKASDWVNTNSKSYPVADKRIETAFAWRATQYVAEDGYIGFVLPAIQMLFSSKGTSTKFRRTFFKKNEVRRITNFSNFHYILFEADVSAITIVYQKANINRKKKPVWHYSPFVANQTFSQLNKDKLNKPWTIIINKSEITRIDSDEAEKGKAFTWKMAFWGSYEDERAFTRLRNTYSRVFSSLRRERKWKLHKGLELRSEAQNKEEDPIVPIDKWVFEEYGDDIKILSPTLLNKLNYRFSVPLEALEPIPIEMRYVREGRKIGYNLISAPHLILNSKYAVYSDIDFAVGSQYAVAASNYDSDYLKAISVYFSSRICRYLIFFMNPNWGIAREVLSKRDWESLPVPSFSETQLTKLAQLQDELATRERKGEEKRLLQQILDSHIEEALEIPTSIRLLIHDFFDVKLTFNKKKDLRNVTAVNLVKPENLEKYALRLRNELDEFAEGGNDKHSISIIYSNDLTVCRISIFKTDETQEIKVEEANSKNKIEFENIKKGIQEKFSQWIYVQREVTYFDANSENFYICKSSRLIDWVESKAISDANIFIGEVLANNRNNLSNISQPQVYGNNIPTQL
jgi:hypothetical protein